MFANSDGDELDLATRLAIAARGHPPNSQQRQKALTALISAVRESGKLRRPASKLPAAIYVDVYDEAIQELWLYICQNIELYNPERASVITWINFLLSRRFLPNTMKMIVESQRLRKSLVDLENIPSPGQLPNLTDNLKKCLEEDAEDIFMKLHVKGHPEANFKAIVLRKLEGATWNEIAEELGLPLSTITGFYYRSIKKMRKKLKRLCEIG